MAKAGFLAASCWLCAGAAWAAVPCADTFRLAATLAIETRLFETDQLQQVYAVSPQQEVIKFDASGRECCRYNNRTFGQISLIDATNPYALLLYYADYQQIVWLDRTLNPIGSLNLATAGIVSATAVGSTNDGNCWVYDEVSFKLKKFGRDGTLLLESAAANQATGFPLQPTRLTERKNQVFLLQPGTGVFAFDNFGMYLQRFDLPDATDLQLFDDQLVYRRGGRYYNFDFRILRERELILPEPLAPDDQLSIQYERYFVRKKDRIAVYAVVK